MNIDKSIIYINSKDRVSGSSTDFKLNLQPPINNSKSFTIKNIYIRNSTYNITEKNNKFIYRDLSDVNVELTPGMYTHSELAQQLQLIISDIYPISISYNDVLDQFIFVAPNMAGINFNVDDSMNEILGFEKLNYDSETSGGTKILNSKLSPELLPNKFFYIDCSNIVQSEPAYIAGVNSYNIIARASLFTELGNVVKNGLIKYENPLEIKYNLGGKRINQLDIRLLDENFEVVDLRGAEWNFDIIIER